MRPAIERLVRYARASWIDLRMFLTGKSDPEIPPLRLQFVGSGDFRAVGRHLFELTLTHGRIQPDSQLLDIGCGSGRLALPLTSYLRSGTYEGFDVVVPAIRWCRLNISRRHPNFHFLHAALKNDDYSLRGGSASDFVFPYIRSRFDCVVAYSLFTHLQFDEIRNYIQESYRVLAPAGRLVATFFLLNERSRAAQAAYSEVEQFPYESGSVRLASRTNPALAVAVEETDLRRLLEEAGFSRITIEPGSWLGVQNAPTFQDLVVCEK